MEISLIRMGETERKKYLIPFLIIGVFAAACGATLIKLTDAPALVITAYRMIFASIFLIPFVVLKTPKKVLNLGEKDVILSIFAGILLAVHFGSWTMSLEYISVPPAILLVNVHPAFIVLFSFLILKETFVRKEILGVLFTLLGMVLIIFPGMVSSLSLFGSVLALVGPRPSADT